MQIKDLNYQKLDLYSNPFDNEQFGISLAIMQFSISIKKPALSNNEGAGLYKESI